MRTAAEYRNELYEIVEAMDDETFESWYGTFSPDSRFDFPSSYGARYQLIKAKQIVKMKKA